MKKINDLKNKKILVLGLAKSGVSAAQLLQKLGADVTVNDYKPLSENPEGVSLLDKGIRVICGEHPADLLDEGFELIVKNPGIPYTNPVIKDAQQRNIPIITEVELAYKISDAEFIGITGTNGKTTTTTLIYEMLKMAEQNPLIAGNIGTVSSDVAQKATENNKIVIELSSFQLMGTLEFRPKIAVLTNLFDAHLDYHGTRTEYVQAKAKIAANQTENDYFVVNYDQDECMDLAKRSKANIIPFSVHHYLENGACLQDGFIYFQGEKVMAYNEVVLPGKHNLANILAAISVVKIAGVENKSIEKVLTSFRGVKHRMQFLGEVKGRLVYNDSKATNILSTKAALDSFQKPIVLLAGGLDRGDHFEELIPSLGNVKAMILFGQTKERLERIGRNAGIEKVYTVDNVEEAVPLAFSLSDLGDVILLSPACASWDQYKSFEVRGDIFIDAVHKLV